MQRLPGPVRAKAVEIANALLAEGMEEGKAIRIAIAKAKEWAHRHPRAKIMTSTAHRLFYYLG